jgi:hypothetical protein
MHLDLHPNPFRSCYVSVIFRHSTAVIELLNHAIVRVSIQRMLTIKTTRSSPKLHTLHASPSRSGRYRPMRRMSTCASNIKHAQATTSKHKSDFTCQKNHQATQQPTTLLPPCYIPPTCSSPQLHKLPSQADPLQACSEELPRDCPRHGLALSEELWWGLPACLRAVVHGQATCM